jgi:hypothetical protein
MTKADAKILKEVLSEVRALNERVSLTIPTESLDEYAHPERILASYRKALKQFPPSHGRRPHRGF